MNCTKISIKVSFHLNWLKCFCFHLYLVELILSTNPSVIHLSYNLDPFNIFTWWELVNLIEKKIKRLWRNMLKNRWMSLTMIFHNNHISMNMCKSYIRRHYIDCEHRVYNKCDGHIQLIFSFINMCTRDVEKTLHHDL